MSRSISIWYKHPGGGETEIEVESGYYLLGTQQFSLQFWGIVRSMQLGIDRLGELGVTDPVWFVGWDDLEVLRKEIELLEQHAAGIEFNGELKARWLSNLKYCYGLLVEKAPKDSEPNFMVG